MGASSTSMYCKLGMYHKTLLGNKHCLCNVEHLFGANNKIVVFLSLWCLIAIVCGYSIILSNCGYLVIIKLVNGLVYPPERKAYGLRPS